MKIFGLLLLFLLMSCGKQSEGGNGSACISREEKILNCMAKQIAWNNNPTQWQIDQARQWCEREYPIKQCY